MHHSSHAPFARVAAGPRVFICDACAEILRGERAKQHGELGPAATRANGAWLE